MYKKEILDNGIRVVTEIIPHVRSASLGIWVDVGSRDEAPAENGISHFIEHMLFKGTRKRSARDIAIEMDSMGGELNAFTSKEGTTYYVKVLDEHLPRAVDLLSDIFNHSVFDPKEIDRERKVILEEIKMVEDTPDDLVHELLYETVWRGNPLGQPVLGSRKTVGGLTRENVKDYLAKYYRPSNIVISAAGKFDRNRLIDMLNDSFGGRKKNSPPKNSVPVAFNKDMKVSSRKLEQAHICIASEGLPYNHKDRFGIYAMNTLLGSSMSSRLFQEIREKRGLAYSVYSYLTSMKDTGLLVIYTGVSPSKAPSVVKLISKEIKKIRKDGVTVEELDKVKEQLKGNVVLAMENTYNRMSQLAKQELYLDRHYTIDEVLDQINQVNKEQVEGIVKTVFKEGRMALTALGPITKQDIAAEAAEF